MERLPMPQCHLNNFYPMLIYSMAKACLDRSILFKVNKDYNYSITKTKTKDKRDKRTPDQFWTRFFLLFDLSFSLNYNTIAFGV